MVQYIRNIFLNNDDLHYEKNLLEKYVIAEIKLMIISYSYEKDAATQANGRRGIKAKKLFSATNTTRTVGRKCKIMQFLYGFKTLLGGKLPSPKGI